MTSSPQSLLGAVPTPDLPPAEPGRATIRFLGRRVTPPDPGLVAPLTPGRTNDLPYTPIVHRLPTGFFTQQSHTWL